MLWRNFTHCIFHTYLNYVYHGGNTLEIKICIVNCSPIYLDGLDDIGTNTCEFYAYDNYGGLDDANNQWYYDDGSNWILAGANDVNITCTSNNICLWRP